MMNPSYKQQLANNDRSQRSVFVGNISYEITEETIRSIFSKVGNCVSIKMVHDRETGKPKGYGFIEYQDIPTAELAIRNLNGFELSGRPLRVDSAAGGINTIEEFNSLQAALGAQPEENQYGPECDASKAPEAISKCIASLAPEKMFELMKQMKDVVLTNQNEVRSMLTSNPQLAYALLQAQVVMRIVDPQVAVAMLHREAPATLKPFHQQVPSQTNPTGQPSQFQIPPSTSIQPKTAPVGYGGYQAQPVPPSQPTRQQPLMHMQPQVQQQQRFPPQQAIPQQQQQQQQPDITLEEQQNAELLMQVMQLSEKDLEQLPPGDREKIIELRQQLKRNVK